MPGFFRRSFSQVNADLLVYLSSARRFIIGFPFFTESHNRVVSVFLHESNASFNHRCLSSSDRTLFIQKTTCKTLLLFLFSFFVLCEVFLDVVQSSTRGSCGQMRHDPSRVHGSPRSLCVVYLLTVDLPIRQRERFRLLPLPGPAPRQKDKTRQSI